MAEWLVEQGIGETRAMLVDGGRILEMEIEPDGGGHKVGAIVQARLVSRANGRGRAVLSDGSDALLQPIPTGLTDGARLFVEVIREAYVEPGGQPKLAVVRGSDSKEERPGPSLIDRIGPSRAAGNLFETHGWTEALEEASSGIVAMPQAMLRISLTPAMTLIDVDGGSDPATLAVDGAALAGQIIRRFGIVGSIGIDLPTLESRAARLAAAEALDATLPQPFERTAVNGFGFLQIVRRRTRPSLMERIAADRPLAAARSLLRSAERARGKGELALVAAAPVIAAIEARPEWIDTLARRTGTGLALRTDPSLAISAGHAHYAHP